MPSPDHLDRLVLNQPSLPKARQWLEWLRYHYPRLPADTGWKCAARDALLALHHAIALSARRLRGNPIWDFQGTMTEDTASLEDFARRALRIYEQINQKDVPERFAAVMDCLYGALRQQVRLGREIDLMRRMGHLDVDVLVDTKNEVATEQ